MSIEEREDEDRDKRFQEGRFSYLNKVLELGRLREPLLVKLYQYDAKGKLTQENVEAQFCWTNREGWTDIDWDLSRHNLEKFDLSAFTKHIDFLK